MSARARTDSNAVHLLMLDLSLACGADGKIYSSSVLSEVTCARCWMAWTAVTA